jgi:hypothetical protein
MSLAFFAKATARSRDAIFCIAGAFREITETAIPTLAVLTSFANIEQCNLSTAQQARFCFDCGDCFEHLGGGFAQGIRSLDMGLTVPVARTILLLLEQPSMTNLRR